MMDDSQRIVKCGALSLHSQGGFFKRRWLSKYLVLYDGSKSGIKRLELFDSEIKFKKQNPAKIIALVDCIRVVTCQRGHKTSYTFEVRTSEQFYLLAAQSFQDMNDWVNCLRLVAFGQPLAPTGGHQPAAGSNGTGNPLAKQMAAHEPQMVKAGSSNLNNNSSYNNNNNNSNKLKSADELSAIPPPCPSKPVDILLDKHRHQLAGQHQSLNDQSSSVSSSATGGGKAPLTASQAAAAAASASAKARQRQPSLLGSCKPQPPRDSPFIHRPAAVSLGDDQPQLTGSNLLASHNPNTLTPSVRGQLIAASATPAPLTSSSFSGQPNATRARDSEGPSKQNNQLLAATRRIVSGPSLSLQQQTLDEEEENMLYCSIEDNPSEHNYRVKVIETELSLRCQLKCYQLTAPTTVDQQYEQLPNNRSNSLALANDRQPPPLEHPAQMVTFYQLIIGPQELTLLNDYASFKPASLQQQGLWSWPYQCIRRYGFDKDNCFMFEAGRKCSSGPGQFVVQTPKAYSIYQDVVKFVNELRSLSSSNPTSSSTTTTTSNPQSALSQSSASPVTNLASQITQIPVAWNNPLLPNNPESNGSAQRDHFFQNLHQSVATKPILVPPPKSGNEFSSASEAGLSVSSVGERQANEKKTPPKVPAKPASINLKLDDINSSPSSPAANKSPPNANANASPARCNFTNCDSKSSEETDESGYEGVESSLSEKQPKTNNKSAQMIDKKTTNNNNNNSHQAQPQSAKSRLLGIHRDATISNNNNANGNKSSPAKSTTVESPISRLGNTPPGMIGNDRVAGDPRRRQHDDFEANLIRDVYCEISKLHATFAVVANDSSEDSMSSHSSRSSSTSITNSTDTCGNNHYNQPGSSHSSSSSSSSSSLLSNDESANSLSGPSLAEPHYTNLTRPRSGAKTNQSQSQDNCDSKVSLTEKRNCKLDADKATIPRQNQMVAKESDNSPSSYDILVSNRDMCHPNQNQNQRRDFPAAPASLPLSIEPIEANYPGLSPMRMCHPMYLGCMLNPIPEVGEPPLGNNNGNNKDSNSKLQSRSVPKATNQHYLINDVQYAKIYRK